jgi:hypothetical protein
MKQRYSLNNNNQLVTIISPAGEQIVADGELFVDNNGSLTYLVKEKEDWRVQYGFRRVINFKGKWRLSANHDLEFVLSQTDYQYQGDILAIKSRIISADNDELVFGITAVNKRGLAQVKTLKLSGAWQADALNRINFVIERKDSPDTLVFKNIWSINKNQQIEYKYEKVNLKTKTKALQTITFEGFWQIAQAKRLRYIFSRGNKSVFDFRVQFESPNLYPKNKTIKYRIGIGFAQRSPVGKRMISLYGTWKFDRKLGVLFEIEYGAGKIQSMAFGYKVTFSSKNELTLALRNNRGEPLGISLTLTHKFLKNAGAEAFIALAVTREKPTFRAGLRIPF